MLVMGTFWRVSRCLVAYRFLLASYKFDAERAEKANEESDELLSVKD